MAKSAALAADLPDMSEEALAKLYTWGKSSCETFDVHMGNHGAMLLVAVRKKAGNRTGPSTAVKDKSAQLESGDASEANELAAADA